MWKMREQKATTKFPVSVTITKPHRRGWRWGVEEISSVYVIRGLCLLVAAGVPESHASNFAFLRTTRSYYVISALNASIVSSETALLICCFTDTARGWGKRETEKERQSDGQRQREKDRNTHTHTHAHTHTRTHARKEREREVTAYKTRTLL